MGFKEQINQINQKINQFVNFIINKLANFKDLSLGEQIAYPAIGLGLLLLLISIVLFVI